MLIVFLLVFFLSTHTASAAPALQPVPLGELTAQLYSYALKIAGLAVFLMFILAGLTAMIPGLDKRFGAPAAIIKDAIIGLIILVSAYLVLNSISSDLVQSATP